MNKMMKDAKFKKYALIGICVLIVLAVAAFYYFSSFESTDDAYVQGHIVSISAQIEGEVTHVHINDNQLVKAGDVLVDIDERNYAAKRDMAAADFKSAQAEDRQAAQDKDRYTQLQAKGEISKQQLDQAVLRFDTAEANVLRAQAKMKQAQLDLEHTKVLAPCEGRISAKNVEEGAYVQIGQPLLAVVPSEVWVVANFKETQMKHIAPGELVDIQADIYPGVTFRGHVDSIQRGSGDVFSILPAQNSTGNFIKIVQRVPVKIVFDGHEDDDPLSPGLSVVPKVYLRPIKNHD